MRYYLLDLYQQTVWTPSINLSISNIFNMICSPLLFGFSGIFTGGWAHLKMTPMSYTQCAVQSTRDTLEIHALSWGITIGIRRKKWDQCIVIIILRMGETSLYFSRKIRKLQNRVYLNHFYNYNWPQIHNNDGKLFFCVLYLAPFKRISLRMDVCRMAHTGSPWFERLNLL